MSDKRYTKIAVLGAGHWGTALALSAARTGVEVLVYSERPEYVSQVNETRSVPYFSNARLAEHYQATENLEETLHADLILIAVPAQKIRALALTMLAISDQWPPLLICSKGIELDTGLLPSQIIEQILHNMQTAILAGPNFASEVAEQQLTASMIAAEDKAFGYRIINTLQSDHLLLCYCNDLIGVQVLAAAKNVYSIASGIAHGMNLGLNAKAALIAAAVKEMTELCVIMGGQVSTMLGLAGIGDLFLSASNQTSRNMNFGYQIGNGQNLQEIMAQNVLHEGYMTTKILYEMANKLGLEAPVLEAVYGILYRNITPQEAIEQLKWRP